MLFGSFHSRGIIAPSEFTELRHLRSTFVDDGLCITFMESPWTSRFRRFSVSMVNRGLNQNSGQDFGSTLVHGLGKMLVKACANSQVTPLELDSRDCDFLLRQQILNLLAIFLMGQLNMHISQTSRSLKRSRISKIS